MNVDCDGNENICEAIIITIIPFHVKKKSVMKHDMIKFNLTQFECRIQNLFNLLVNREKLKVCFIPRSVTLKSITPQLQCEFF